ncbi:MAG: glycosyltransferase family 39 protein [Planctomycetaceae bacterium]|nr:glycosyltransferase family 39 protein [Planctomycetaceae bacterium]
MSSTISATHTEESSIHSFRGTILLVILLLTIHALLLAYSATKHSPTALEGPLLAAGVSHWELGRYELYRVNPPLVRMVAAMPVMLVGCETDWRRFVDGPRARPEYSIGSQFIEINGERSLWLMTLARWACIPFSLIGGLYCFFWARELFRNDMAGLIALALWCFDPLILANGKLITNDLAATSFGIVAGYYFWHWLKSPSWIQCFIVALAFALAILAKTTWLFLFGLWPMMAALWFGMKYWRRETVEKTWMLITLQIATIFLLTIWFINIFYRFDGSLENYGDYSFVSKKLSAIDNQHPLLASIPVPFPKQFVIGIDTQICDFEDYRQMSYLAGQWQDQGWYYYYVYGLLVKWPHGTQILFLLAMFMAICWKKYGLSRDEWVLIIPALTVLLLVSVQLEFNMHFRYVLPFVGFAFIFIGKIALLMDKGLFWRVIVSLLIVLSTVSSLWNYPHSLAYFNEMSGGTKNGHKQMLHSAIDWGQDLLYLKQWLANHPEIELDGLAYHGGFDPSAIGIESPRPPVDSNSSSAAWMDSSKVGPQPGWYALSINAIWSADGEYTYFRHLTPLITVGKTIHIYYITSKTCTN